MKRIFNTLKRFLRTRGILPAKQVRYPYQFVVNKHFAELGDELAAPIRWQRPATYNLPGDTAARFVGMAGTHKWHHYFAIYDELFAKLRSKPIKLLEIGVYQGASAQVWRQYFHPDSVIVGVDINPECAKFANPSANLHIRIGSQQDPAFLTQVVAEFGPFDLIIDDGSHITSHMITSFNHLFASGLKAGGLYFAEDTHTSFWPNYRDSQKSFVDFCFFLVKCMHVQYSAVGIDEHQFHVGGPDSVPFMVVPRITTLIDEIRFFDSVIAISKSIDRQLPQSQHW